MSKIVNKEDSQERGASMVEYAILVALVVIISIAAVKLMGQTVSQTYSTTATTLDNNL